jgi:hypothetical protein
MAANTTTDHETIRDWAESKGGKPAAVDRTHQGGDVGIIRIMFPDSPRSEHHSLVEITWEEFFKQFEDSKLALLYEEDSLFSKIVGRDTLERRDDGEHASRHDHRDAADSRGGDHRSSSRGHGESSAGGRESEDESADLKSREYRDADGNVHHHTRTYVEQHRDKK